MIFFATGLRLRLVFMPLLLLLFLVNIGYTISAIAVFDRPEVPNWIATSWYMAVTVISSRWSSPRTLRPGSTCSAAASSSAR